MRGTLSKMTTRLDDVVHYELVLGEHRLALNEGIGKPLKLRYSGQIFCDACGRRTNKSFAQGHCYPCMSSLARCDMCIMKPETCHFAAGTCREPAWGEQHCMTGTLVYLANTSGLKVGITRLNQVPTRWMDQGATQALPILRASTRHVAGLIEVTLARTLADKTNWRAILKGNAAPLDLAALAATALQENAAEIEEIVAEHGDDSVTILDEAVLDINYPVTRFPEVRFVARKSQRSIRSIWAP